MVCKFSSELLRLILNYKTSRLATGLNNIEITAMCIVWCFWMVAAWLPKVTYDVVESEDASVETVDDESTLTWVLTGSLKEKFPLSLIHPLSGVFVNMDNPLLNRTVDGLFNIGTVGASSVPTEEFYSALNKVINWLCLLFV